MNSKKKILLTAGGTATTWHFCNIIKQYFPNDFEIHVCDINEEFLVPASLLADTFHRVPSVYEDNYKEHMYNLLEKEQIDIIVPLIDFDLLTFANDNPELQKLNVYSTAPSEKTIQTLSDKNNMNKFMTENGICTPKIYSINEIDFNKEYILKPIKGFGSRNVRVVKGSQIEANIDEGEIIQEKCNSKEVTAEIYNGEFLKVFVRERVETKCGVCTKMIPVYDDKIYNTIYNLTQKIECPKAFCIQFMKNSEDKWAIVDCNLRIGAGTALSTKIGFQLVRALLTDLLGKKVDENLFTIDTDVKSVLRVYDEVIIK